MIAFVFIGDRLEALPRVEPCEPVDAIDIAPEHVKLNRRQYEQLHAAERGIEGAWRRANSDR